MRVNLTPNFTVSSFHAEKNDSKMTLKGTVEHYSKHSKNSVLSLISDKSVQGTYLHNQSSR